MCAIDYCDERFDTYHTKLISRSRKEHRCDECSRAIAVGEPYLYAFGVYDGSGDSFHICQHCKVATDWLKRNCDGFVHGGVREDIEEHVQEYPALRLGLMRLRLGMGRKWKSFKSDGLLPLPRQARDISIDERV